MAQKVVDARQGQQPAGSDAWFWSAALEPDDNLRPYWETMPFLPRPAQVARVAAKQVTTFADDPLDEERRDGERLIQAAMYLFFASQWIRLRRQLRASRKDLEAARKVRRQIAILIGLDWGQEQGRLWVGLAPVLDGVIGTAKKSIWVQLASLGVELSWDVYDRAAAQWAMKYRYDLVTRINASTQNMLGRTISRWIASDQDFEELTEKVWRLVPTNPYPNLVDRPRVIAQTETTRVYAESRMAGLKAAGLHRMVWQTANDERVCPICRVLHNREGSIEMGVLNPENGRYYKPPGHIACRCWLTAAPAELEARTRPYPLPTMPGEAAKHAGPGDHPGTGTPQSVHGGGGGGKVDWLAMLEAASVTADVQPRETVTILYTSAPWYEWTGANATIRNQRAFLDFFAVDGYEASILIQELPAVDNKEAVLTVWYSRIDGARAGTVDFSLTKSGLGTVVVNEDFYRHPETGIGTLSWTKFEMQDKDLYYALKDRLAPENLSKEMGWPHLKVDTEPADDRWFSEREMRLIEEYPSADRRREVKLKGESALIDDTDWPQAGGFQKEWARHSNDEGNASDWLQVEAWTRAGKPESVSVTKGMKMAELGLQHDQTSQWTAKAYDSIYRRTQQYFADRGFKPDDEIVLFRGVALAKAAYPDVSQALLGEDVMIKPRPLQSFSTSVSEASRFAGDYTKYRDEFGLVVGVRVPVREIFAHWSTGMGCMTEDEMIVKGSYLAKTPVEVVRIWRR